MEKFFECGLPKTAGHLPRELQEKYAEVRGRISERMERLQEALEISGMKPETFQQILSSLFKLEQDRVGNVEHFDSMSAKQLSIYAKMVFDGKDEDYERLTFPNADVLFDTAYASTADWELIRHIGIGGSDAAVIHASSSYRTATSLYLDKTGQSLPKKSDKAAIFERGHFLEDEVIGAFCRRTGAKRIRDTRMFRSKKYPHCIADIDGILELPGGKIYLFEAKTTKTENQAAWMSGRIPKAYAVQSRHYPAVLDDDRICGTFIGCLFVVDYEMFGSFVGAQYDTSAFISQLIERDAVTEDQLLAENEAWWENYVALLEPPPQNGDPKLELEAIEATLPAPDPKAEILDWSDDPDLSYLVAQYLDLSEKKKKIEEESIAPVSEQMLALKNELIKAMGEHTSARVELNDGTIKVAYSAPKQKRVVNAQDLLSLYPAIYDQVAEQTETSRRFTCSRK